MKINEGFFGNPIRQNSQILSDDIISNEIDVNILDMKFCVGEDKILNYTLFKVDGDFYLCASYIHNLSFASQDSKKNVNNIVKIGNDGTLEKVGDKFCNIIMKNCLAWNIYFNMAGLQTFRDCINNIELINSSGNNEPDTWKKIRQYGQTVISDPDVFIDREFINNTGAWYKVLRGDGCTILSSDIYNDIDDMRLRNSWVGIAAKLENAVYHLTNIHVDFIKMGLNN